MSLRDEVLEEVTEAGGTAVEIAVNIGAPPAAVRRVLKQLEADGLVWSDKYQKRVRVWGSDA